MIFEQEFDIDRINPDNFKRNYNTLIPVKIMNTGFIPEKRLMCPCSGTKMSIDLILKYQEQGFIIHYDDVYAEDIFLLINLYNKKLEYEQSQNRHMGMKFLDKSYQYVVKKLRKHPEKYGKLLNDIKVKGNPFISASEVYQQRNNHQTTELVEKLKAEMEMRDEAENQNSQITWEEREVAYSYLDDFFEAFRQVNNLPKEGDVSLNILKPLKDLTEKEKNQKLKTFELN